MARSMSPWATLINTPGMSTDSPAYKAMLSTFPPSPPRRRISAYDTPEIRGLKADLVTVDELQYLENDPMKPHDDAPPSTLLEAELADLAQELTDHFVSDAAIPGQINTCALSGPDTLTVHSPVKGYRKAPHVGGEQFYPARAYVGKRGVILIEFVPVEAAPYERMEMSAGEALGKLSGFDLISRLGDDSLSDRLRGLGKKASAIREQEANVTKFDTYKDLGFGTF